MKYGVLVLIVAGGCSFESGSGGPPGTGPGSSGSSTGLPITTDPSEVTTNLPTDPTGSESDSTDGATTNGPGTTSGDTSGDPTSTTSGTTVGPSETTDGTSSSSGGPGSVLCDESDPDLRACYDFADVGGGMLADLSMYENDGTVTMAPATGGPFGGAVQLGDDAEISVPDSPSLDMPGPATWEVWVNLDDLPDNGRVGVLDRDGQYSIFIYPRYGMRCNGGTVNAFLAVPTGAWVHLACVYEDGTITAWVDGVASEGVSGGQPLVTDPSTVMALGDSSPGFTEPMDGRVAAARIWSIALTDAEIIDAAAAR